MNNSDSKKHWDFLVQNFLAEYKQQLVNKPPLKTLNQRRQQKMQYQYNLDGKFENIYLTQREAECMALLLKRESITAIGKILKLSPCTVECYIRNIKTKLGCNSELDLIDAILNTNFVNMIDDVMKKCAELNFLSGKS